MSLMTMNKLKNSMCCWPIGDPKEGGFHFCGDPSEPARPYCEQHSAVAHNTPPVRRRPFVRTKKKKAA